MTRRLLGPLAAMAVTAAACVPDERPAIISHRAAGVGSDEENVPANVPLVLAAGFGVEIDVRGDGAGPFELGHLRTNGHSLRQVLATLRAEWQPSFAGKILILDVANDEGYTVSNGLIDLLYEEVPGTPLAELQIIIESSTIESLTRLHTWQEARGATLPLLFAMTYWYSPEYTVPPWIDLVAANVSELPDFAHPKPLLLFGVDTRQALRLALTSRSTIFGLITDHPRRAAEF